MLHALAAILALGAGKSCGEVTFSSKGATYRVLFAGNGAVQRYVLEKPAASEERNHDALVEAEAKYGPEALDAPPVHIISFRNGPGGLMIPDKTVDSCGRISHIQ